MIRPFKSSGENEFEKRSLHRSSREICFSNLTGHCVHFPVTRYVYNSSVLFSATIPPVSYLEDWDMLSRNIYFANCNILIATTLRLLFLLFIVSPSYETLILITCKQSLYSAVWHLDKRENHRLNLQRVLVQFFKKISNQQL